MQPDRRGTKPRKNVLPSIGVYTALIAVCAFMASPLAWGFVSSLKVLEDVYTFPPSLGLSHPNWSNYSETLSRLPLPRFLFNSAVIAAAGVSGAVLTSSMTGFALARLRFRGRRACFTLLVLSMLLPAPVLWIPRFLLFDALGWLDTYRPLIVPAWLGGGAFNIFLFRQFFRTIPREFEDAAQLDGAATWQTFWHVFLPMARPATVTSLLLSFVYHWQEFLDPLLYLSDFMTFPVSMGLRMYQSLAGTWANLLMAASLIALAPVVIVFLLCERNLMAALGAIGDRHAGEA